MKSYLRGKSTEYRNNNSAQRGFSLIELIVVIAIMAVLIGLIAPNFLQYVQKNRVEACRKNREAALDIYARCVYDNSVEIYLTDAAGKDINYALNLDGSGGYTPVQKELEQHMLCPVQSSTNVRNGLWKGGVDTATGTAYIECEACAATKFANGAGDPISLDMLGWAAKTPSPGVDAPITPPVKPTPTQDKKELVTVTFNLLGKGGPQPEQQTINAGDKATKPDDPKADTYVFGGWYTDTDCTEKWNFSAPVNESMTLYAKWTGFGSSSLFPYADDPYWWDPSMNGDPEKGHRDQLIDSALVKDDTDLWIVIKTPSPIFTSRAGGQFVFINRENTVKIKKSEATTPELWSANNSQDLVQLTGQKVTIDITGKSGGMQIGTDNNNTIGDLIEFVDGDNVYLYVYFHAQGGSDSVDFNQIRNGANKTGNCYAVGKAAGGGYYDNPN